MLTTTQINKTYVIPIFKKGDCEEPNIYRPISITPALFKISEKVLRDQITQYLNRNKLLSSSQFRFRDNFSSVDALLCATENIRKKIKDNENVAAAFLDLSKAFDPFPVVYCWTNCENLISVIMQSH